jgi:arylsulfatase A-like enzyme
MEQASQKNNCFLWIHFFDAHIPYYAPNNFIQEDFPDLEKLHSASSSLREQLDEQDLFNPLARSPMAEVFYDISYFPRLYRTALRYIDKELGCLFEQLKLMGVYDDTLIVVTSDHGENLNEHGVYCHHRKLFDTTTHVPLILKDFDNEWAGTQIKDIVQHIDVAPTILNRLQQAVPEKFRGKNLWPLISEADSSANEYAICEHAHNYQRSIRTKDWLYIKSEKDPAKHIASKSPKDHSDKFPLNEPDFLLDRNDPVGRNLWNEFPDVVKKLSERLEEILRQNREDHLPYEDLPESLKNQLEGLGYF